MWFRTKWVVLWSLWAARLARVPTPPLRVSSGELRGTVSADGTYLQYLGIPYASVPEILQAPGPPPTWEGTFEAVNENVRCTQLVSRTGTTVMGQDDCLTLNVYTPLTKHPSTSLPVMVFIHGGGFFSGSSNKAIYGPGYLIDKGVILVTINYRLGVPGYLSLGIREAPGNVGMKDQVAALRWVQKNIRVFGGDPDNVTIFGESAGAASVSFHLLSPMSTGLFHKAIIQSGSSLASWAFQHDPIEAALIKAKAMGYTGSSDPHELYNFFNSKTSTELFTVRAPRKKGNVLISELSFTPCVEKVFDGVEAFLTESPYKILSEGRYNKVPLIIGANLVEGILFASMETDEELQQIELEKALPKNLIFPSEDERKRIADETRKIYTIKGDNMKSLENKDKFCEFTGEPFFNYHIAEEACLIAKTSDKPVFSYLFEYDGWRNVVKMLMSSEDTKKLKGATHADELFYLFSQIPSMGEDRMIEIMTTMWTNFAKYGDPTPVVTDLLPVKWPVVTKEDQRSLVIGQKLSIASMWRDRLLFWKDVYSKYRRK